MPFEGTSWLEMVFLPATADLRNRRLIKDVFLLTMVAVMDLPDVKPQEGHLAAAMRSCLRKLIYTMYG